MSSFSALTSLLCAVAIAFPAVAAEEDAKAALAEFQGAWKLHSVRRGESSRDLADEPLQCTIKGDKFLYGGEEFARLKIGGEGAVRTIDLVFSGSDEAKEGVYVIEKESLKICLNWEAGGVKERPPEFVTQGHPGRRIVEFRKVAAPQPDDQTPALGFVGMALKTGETQTEIVVVGALEGTPAAKAGIEKDDLLQEIDGTKVTDLPSTIVRVRQAKPGSEITIKVKRQGEAKEFKIKVGVFPIRALLE